MNKVLKLQRVGLITPTLVEYEGKVLATNQLDIESTCNLWRCHFGFYSTEKIDLAMTKKEFSVIQQKTLSSVKSVYDLFYEQNFIPRVFESKEEVSEWGMYRTNEVEKLKSENAALRERLGKAVELPVKLGDPVYYLQYFCDYKGCDSTTQQFCCGCKEMIEREKSKEYYVIREKPFELKDLPKIGKKYFTTREAALARLAEQEGGKE